MNRIFFREYSILCIGKIWVDWPGMDLLIYPRSCFGPNEPSLCFGLICCMESTIPLGLASGILGPFLYPHHNLFYSFHFMFWRFLGICTCSNSICSSFFWVVALIHVLLMDPLFCLIRSL